MNPIAKLNKKIDNLDESPRLVLFFLLSIPILFLLLSDNGNLQGMGVIIYLMIYVLRLVNALDKETRGEKELKIQVGNGESHVPRRDGG